MGEQSNLLCTRILSHLCRYPVCREGEPSSLLFRWGFFPKMGACVKRVPWKCGKPDTRHLSEAIKCQIATGSHTDGTCPWCVRSVREMAIDQLREILISHFVECPSTGVFLIITKTEEKPQLRDIPRNDGSALLRTVKVIKTRGRANCHGDRSRRRQDSYCDVVSWRDPGTEKGRQVKTKEMSMK